MYMWNGLTIMKYGFIPFWGWRHCTIIKHPLLQWYSGQCSRSCVQTPPGTRETCQKFVCSGCLVWISLSKTYWHTVISDIMADHFLVCRHITCDHGLILLCGMVWFYAYKCYICLPISAHGLREWLMILTLLAQLT